MDTKVLGIIGGLGPMATVYFYEMLVSHTKATSDAEHIDVLISGKATTPDRTAYILNPANPNPAPVMAEEAKKLESIGAELLLIPCNTAYYFVGEIEKSVNIPVLNIITETVNHCMKNNIKHVGIMATEGTIAGGLYQNAFQNTGVTLTFPSEKMQKGIMSIIYDDIKANREPDLKIFREASDELDAAGCEYIILACTELSVLKKEKHLGLHYIDPLEILAYKAIKACGKTPTGFGEK